MGENIIKARQTAKIATSSEWEDSTLPLKRGELTINETTGEMRFGDGVDTFNNSPKVKTVPLSHSSSSTEYGSGNGENYGHVKLSDSTSSTSDVSDGTAATPAAVKAAYDLANSKANKSTNYGGFEGGSGADVTGSGAAIGLEAESNSGGAVGDTVSTNNGGSVGQFAKSTDGAAVGENTKTGDGVAIGKEAKTVDSSNNGIDAIQLGTGTNSTEKTIQVYNYQLMDANGKIPADRLSPHASTSNTYGVGDSANYGHLKLSDSTSSTSRATGGVAATPYAVKAAYEYAESIEMEITDMKDNAVLYTVDTFTSDSGSNYVATVDGLTEYKSGMLLIFSPNVTSTDKQPYLNINGLGNKRIVRRFTAAMSSYSEQYINDNFYVGFSYLLQYDGNSFIDVTRPQTSWQDVSGKPTTFTPSSHASTATTYGVGNSSSYGHLKLSASTSSTSGTSSGIAATPSAVKAAYDKANIRKNSASATGDIISTHLTVGSRLADSTIGGNSLVTGQNNIASGDKTASIGGDYNTASGYCAATIGGSNVSVSSNYSGSIGGFSTTVTGAYSSIVGGSSNSVNGDNAAVVGGDGNTAGGDRSVVIGGNDNTASGNNNSVVVGGYNNTASGESSITLGGNNNTASAYQTKVGHYSKTGNAGQGSGTSGDAFIVGNGSSSTRSNAFRVAYSGSVYALSAFNSTGADYAELLEWEDGNADNADRRGLFVTWGANDKIKIANAGDEIVGIISATSSVIGNAYEDSWQGMYLTDAFGQPIIQIVHHDAEYADVEVPDIDEHGNILDTTHTEQQLLREAYDAEEYAVNPEYDPAQEYIPRSQRREWAKVGMLGQLIIIDDGTCMVGGRCTVGDNGKAIASEEGYRVMERIDETHIKIFFK